MIAGEQSALVVLVPEAEPLVKRFRDRYDPAAADRMPAHITVLYPFILPRDLRAEALDSLRAVFSRHEQFDIQLAGVKRWPSVIYLAPRPEEPLRALTQAAVERFPSYPPYGGEFDDVIPHLTMADAKSAGQLDGISDRFLQASAGRLPIDVRVSRVWLMVQHNGVWAPQVPFELGKQE
jgi:2'-5' RNA ligase